ncbi:MAG: S1 RNA-binding domain-containing protein [Patescibacteria group bacterium]|nr:S1 RNA-binding domain-containing protein [Patescibacteria group bacterium]MCL5432374.1 S1 RNA-binding domain-containing protein [Patescibacteria group bacterium]
MEELLKQEGYSLRGYKRGDVVEGRVSSISGKEVLIDFGGKMEGVVGEKEWEVVKEFVSRLSVGDKIKAVVISAENDKGQMIVSIKKAGSKFRWEKAKELLESGEAINVKGVEVNKGGLIVEFEGIRGFVPGSQLASEHQGEIAHMINRVFAAKVIEVDEDQNRLIFSEKAVTGAADLAKKLEELKAKVKIGGKYSGKVAAIVSYGIFVSLELPKGEADGLVHISEISWSKVEDLNSLFKIGDKVEVVVIGISDTDAKLNLSIKQLLPDPWQDLAKKYTADQQVRGKVTKISSYGIFIQLDPSADGGIEGLIHISKVPPEASYEVGDKVTCTVESVDAAAHRISLLPVLTAKPIGYK